MIEDSVGKVKAGTQLVDESGKVLEEIIEGTQKVADIIAEIAAASQEQASGIDQVNNAITQMDNMTQDNAALVEEAAAASRSMQEQALQLTRLMAYFRIDSSRRIGSDGTGRRIGSDTQPEKDAPNVMARQSRLAAAQGSRRVRPADDSSDWEQF